MELTFDQVDRELRLMLTNLVKASGGKVDPMRIEIAADAIELLAASNVDVLYRHWVTRKNKEVV